MRAWQTQGFCDHIHIKMILLELYCCARKTFLFELKTYLILISFNSIIKVYMPTIKL